MNQHSQILVVGRDQSLLQTRRLILGTYFEVEAAGRMSEAGMILSRRNFDVIVLCDTLSDQECRQIADLVRDQEPHPTLVSLLGPGNHRKNSLPGTIAIPGTSFELLKECTEVLSRHPHSKQRTFSN